MATMIVQIVMNNTLGYYGAKKFCRVKETFVTTALLAGKTMAHFKDKEGHNYETKS